jgi:hypothetical protein
LGALNFAALVLGLRLILLVTISGAIILASFSFGSHDVIAYIPLAIYCCAVVVPMVWLAARK